MALPSSDDEDVLIESPRKIQLAYTSQKSKPKTTTTRPAPGFTEAFSFVLLKECFLLIVKVDMTSRDHSGYCYDLELGIQTKDKILTDLNLYGPYNQVSSTGGPIQEITLMPNSSTMYNAKCFVMVPQVDEQNRYGPRTLKRQVQKLADYCNVNYQRNMVKRREESNKNYTIKNRTFGLAADPMTEDSTGHLSSYLTRDSCFFHLRYAMNFDTSFYNEFEALAKQLLAPPYTVQEQECLGYPAPDFN